MVERALQRWMFRSGTLSVNFVVLEGVLGVIALTWSFGGCWWSSSPCSCSASENQLTWSNSSWRQALSASCRGPGNGCWPSGAGTELFVSLHHLRAGGIGWVFPLVCFWGYSSAFNQLRWAEDPSACESWRRVVVRVSPQCSARRDRRMLTQLRGCRMASAVCAQGWPLRRQAERQEQILNHFIVLINSR